MKVNLEQSSNHNIHKRNREYSQSGYLGKSLSFMSGNKRRIVEVYEQEKLRRDNMPASNLKKSVYVNRTASNIKNSVNNSVNKSVKENFNALVSFKGVATTQPITLWAKIVSSKNTEKFLKSKFFRKFSTMAEKNPVIFEAFGALLITCGMRPAVIMALPKSKKDEDKNRKAASHSIASGVIGFVFAKIFYEPFSKAMKKVENSIRYGNPEKYLGEAAKYIHNGKVENYFESANSFVKEAESMPETKNLSSYFNELKNLLINGRKSIDSKTEIKLLDEVLQYVNEHSAKATPASIKKYLNQRIPECTADEKKYLEEFDKYLSSQFSDSDAYMTKTNIEDTKKCLKYIQNTVRVDASKKMLEDMAKSIENKIKDSSLPKATKTVMEKLSNAIKLQSSLTSYSTFNFFVTYGPRIATAFILASMVVGTMPLVDKYIIDKYIFKRKPNEPKIELDPFEQYQAITFKSGLLQKNNQLFSSFKGEIA